MESIKINPGLLTKDIRFPIIQPIAEDHPKNIFSRAKKFLTYRRRFSICAPAVIWSDYIKEYIYLPKTFIFDGASVPKALNNFYGPTGILLYGAPPHDFGYRYAGLLLVDQDTLEVFFEPYSKTTLDKIFKQHCTAENGLPKASFVARLGLKIGGWVSWRKHRKANKILQDDFPVFFSGEAADKGDTNADI